MPDFSVRSSQKEIMDDPNAPEKELWQNLRELEVINTRLGGYNVIFDALNKIKLKKHTTIVDIGSGGGDTLRAVAKWGRKRKLNLSLTGIDLNPVMIRYATTHSSTFPEISYRQHNIFDAVLGTEQADVVMCSLFCHHFAHHDLVRLLKRMSELSSGYVIINDLHRHWLAYYSIKLLTTIFSKTYVVKHDAPLSVARAFTSSDWENIMKEAGIEHYTIKWCWAFRWQVIIQKHDS